MRYLLFVFVITTLVFASVSVSAQNAEPESTSIVRVWWPDSIYPAEDSVAADLLEEQFDADIIFSSGKMK